MMRNRYLQHDDTFAWMVIISIVSLYIWVVISYTSFMPIEDDYSAVLGFINQLTAEDDLSEKIKMFFHQNADHRITFPLLVEAIQYKLTGSINFLYLVLFGNLAWFLVVYLLWKGTSDPQNVPLLYFVPVVLLMFSFTHASLMTWALGSLQQYWQLLFSLLSIFCLVRKKIYIAYIFMILAIFTGGGGFALIPLFILYHIFHKEWKELVWTGLLSAGIIGIYFFVLDFYWQQKTGNMLAVLLSDPMSFPKYIFAFLGNFGAKCPLSMYIGIVLAVLFMVKAKTILQKAPFIWWSIVFVFMIGGITGVSRFVLGPEQALSSRYGIYAVLLASLVYLAYLHIYSRSAKIFVIGLLTALSVYLFHFYDKLPLFEQRKHKAETQLAFPTPSFAEKALKQSYRQRTFTIWKKSVKLPSSLLTLPLLDEKNLHCLWIDGERKSCLSSPEGRGAKTDTPLMAIEDIPIRFRLTGWSVDSPNHHSPYAVVLVLDTYKYRIYPDKNSSIVKEFGEPDYLYSGINEDVVFPPLKAGNYLLEIKTVNRNATGYYETAQIHVVVQSLRILDKLSVVKEPTKGGIEQLMIEGDILRISGWFVLEGHESKEITVIVDIDGQKYAALSNRERPDVEKALGSRMYRHSGFMLRLPLEMLSRGTHTIKVFLLRNDDAKLYETNEKRTLETKK